MHRLFVVVLILLVLAAAVVLARREPDLPEPAFRIEGVVIRVVDGDTLWLADGAGEKKKIRLADIDTPEHAQPACAAPACTRAPHPARPGQPFAAEATRSLRELAPKGVRAEAECQAYDRFGRAICFVFVDGENLNRAQLQRGWARVGAREDWLRDPESEALEAEARAARRGLWQADQTVHPETWRHRCWEGGDCPGALR